MSPPRKRVKPSNPRERGAAAAPRASQPRVRRWLAPPALHPVRAAVDLPLLAAVALALLVVYALSTPRTVLLEDDGLFLMSSVTLGVSHPPGYPLHTLLGWLFAHLPVGTPAFRVHLLSGVLGALACGVLGWVLLRRTGNRVVACVAALAFGVSEHFWSQAILAEVYTLNTLFFFGVLALCQEAAARPTRRMLVAVSAAYGLSLANHWPLMVLTTPALALTLLPAWRDVVRRLPLMTGTAVVCAAVPYAWMVWRSNQDPLIAFYGPISSWRDFVFYVSRRGYARVDVSATAGWSDKVQFAAYFLREAWVALTPIGVGLAAAGLVRQWRSHWHLGTAGEVASFLGCSLVLAFVLGFDYGYLKVAVFRPYPLVAYGLMAMWMGVGLDWAISALGSRSRGLAHGVMAASLLLPAFLLWRNWDVNDRSDDDFGARQARVVLDAVEPGAVMLVYSDADTGPIGYLNVVAHERPDVTLYNLQGLVFRNRLMPAMAGPRLRDARLQAFFAANQRPVYHMTDKILPPLYREEHLGFFKRVLTEAKPGMPRPRYLPEAAAFFRELLAMDLPRDHWVRFTRNQLLHRYGNFLALAQLTRDDELHSRVEALVTLAQADYFCLTGMVEMLAEYGPDRATWERAMTYLDKALPLRDETLDKERLGREDYLRGFLAFRLGDLAASERLFQRSVDVYPAPDNASRLALAQLQQVKSQRKP